VEKLSVESTWPPASQAEADAPPRPRFLLQQVHILYRNQFWTWFGIIAPTSLFAGFVLLWSEKQAKAISNAVPFFEISYHWDKLVEATVVRFGGLLAAWFLGCFALASLASVVNRVEEESAEAAWVPDHHQRAREHIGGVFVLALITFCTFLTGLALAQFVITAAIRVVGWRRFSPFSHAASLIGIVAVASLVSWLGASIPLILRGTKLWAALKRSVELSSGYEGALVLLVLESLTGSLVAFYLVLYSLRFLIPSDLRHAPWYGWVLTLVAALSSATVDAPLFIGFSLLADPEQLNASSFPVSQQTP
jgi:hypothetical protein